MKTIVWILMGVMLLHGCASVEQTPIAMDSADQALEEMQQSVESNVALDEQPEIEAQALLLLC